MADDGNVDKRKHSRSKNDKRVGIFLPLLGTLLIAGLTLWVDHSVSTRAEAESNSRLATELLSRREQAESALRKDMFGTILKGFIDPDNKSASPENLSDRLLKLELLALNFGESLSLGPLFQEINRQIYTPAFYPDQANMALDKADFIDRLEGLTRRVIDRQIAAVATAGISNSIGVDVSSDRVTRGRTYRWPDDYVADSFPDMSEEDLDDMINEKSCLSLHGVAREITMALSNADPDMKMVKVELNIDTTKPAAGSSRECVQEVLSCKPLPDDCQVHIEAGVPINFTLDLFNFPMIDNVLLSYNQRFAIVLHKFEPGTKDDEFEIEMKGVLFPGEYASLRDKPQLDQAIEQLRQSLPGPGGLRQ